MYRSRPGLIIGFHGCDKSIRDAIVNGQTMLRASKNDYDWLGHGMYFWENNFQRAFHFVQEQQRRRLQRKRSIAEPAVLGAVIDLGYCLDLLDKEYIDVVGRSFAGVNGSYSALGAPIPANTSLGTSPDLSIRKLDCAIVEHVHFQMRRRRKPFDSVRGVFIEGQPLYPTAGFYDKSHIQICVRNPNCIKGFFIPRAVNTNWLMP